MKQKIILKKAEIFKDEDNKVKEKIEIKYTLENYCNNILEEINDNKIKSHFSGNEKKQILNWIKDSNEILQEKDKFYIKAKEIENIFIPIMKKNLYENRKKS